MRILVVDDKEDNLYYLSALLQAQGHEVVGARHGAEALALARRAPPDVVISDLLMPVMDGYTLLRQWKADARLGSVPFIVYTATYTEPEDEQLALSLGADAFILKPTEPEDFLSRLREVTTRDTAVVPRPALPTTGAQVVMLREYNETLVRKLEQKTLELEETNRSLQRDIAARARVEAALRHSEGVFRQLTEAIPQLVWMTNGEGSNTYCNQRWVEYTGQGPAASEGLGWYAPFHAEDRGRVEAAWSQAAADGGTCTLEARLRGSDGGYRWFLVRGLPLRDEAGVVTRWLGTCTDIDELKQAAARLQATEAQLRQAQKMEAVGQLAGGVAHDFNNLLSVILSYAALMREELPKDDRMRDDLAEVLHAGQRATDLTRQLLAFSRQQMLQPRVLDLGLVLGGMKKMLARLLGEHIQLVLTVDAPLDPVLADPSQIEQIVMNLAVNARDAMPRGGTLTIGVRNVRVDAVEGAARPNVFAPGAYVVLTVRDTGTGMDAKTRERLFEPFFTTKDLGKGTGLGLSTVYGIVKQSEGHIDVASEPERGTTFEIYLPVTEREAAEVDVFVDPIAAVQGCETLLIVEDDPQVRSSTCAILRRAGYHVVDATDGPDALRIAAEHLGAIDLLITDVVMPHMSGRELAERLVVLRPETRVLYVSGYTETAIVQHGVLDEGIAFLHKPITPDALLRKVHEVLALP